MLDQLRRFDKNDDSNEGKDTNISGNELGTEQGNATGDASGNETKHATEVRAAMNQDCQTETMQQGMLSICMRNCSKMKLETLKT